MRGNGKSITNHPMNHTPTVHHSVFKTVLLILTIEIVIGWSLWQMRGLCIAVSDACARYDSGPEGLAHQQTTE